MPKENKPKRRIITGLDMVDERQKRKAKRRAARKRRREIDGWTHKYQVLKPKPIRIDLKPMPAPNPTARLYTCPKCDGRKWVEMVKFVDKVGPKAGRYTCQGCKGRGQIWL